MRYLFFFLVIFALVACSGRKKVPADILDQPKMTSVISDILIADAVAFEKNSHDSTINIKSLSPVYYRQIFLLHKISKDDFFKSYNYYLNHPDLLKVILDSAYMNTNIKVMPSHPMPDKKPKS